MSWTPASPIAGSDQVNFTSPTYGPVEDTAPDNNGKQYAITSLGGTQAGVFSHLATAPFTLTFVKPKVIKTLGKPNPTTGVITSVPRNVYKLITRKGVLPLAGQPYATMLVTTSIEVVAGSEIADSANVKAAMSAHFGTLYAQSSGLGDSVLLSIL